MKNNNTSPFSSPAGHAAMMDWYARALERTGIEHETLTVFTGYGDTHMVAAGPKDAPPVVLLHGTEGNAASWRHQLAGLHQDFRLYALDIVGSAGKSDPTRLAYDNLDYGHWLSDVLAGLDLVRAHLVGISNGAWLILKLAAYAPERVASAVLMSANGIMPARFPYSLARYIDRKAVHAAKDALATRFLTQGMVRRAVANTYAADAKSDPHEIEWFYLLAKYYRFRFPPGPVTDAEIASLTAPTLLMMGEREKFFDVPAVIGRVNRYVPQVVSETISGVGHNMCTDNPTLINERLRQFISSVAVGQQSAQAH